MPKQLTHIVIDGLKNLRKQRIEVPKFLALEGRNGTGKSAVLQGIRIGVLGYDPDIGKTLEATRTLIPTGIEYATVALAFTDGFAFERTVGEKTDISIKPLRAERTLYDKRTRIERELGSFVPSFDLASFLDLSPEKKREYFLRLLPQGAANVTHDMWKEWLGFEAADPVIQRAIGYLWLNKVVEAPSILDGLAAALKATEELFNEAEQDKHRQQAVTDRAEEDASSSVIEGLTHSPARLEALQREVEEQTRRAGELALEIRRAEDARTRMRERAARRDRIRERLAFEDAAIARIEPLVKDMPEDHTELVKASHYWGRKARSQNDAVSWHAEDLARLHNQVATLRGRFAQLTDKSECPTCGSPINAIDTSALTREMERVNAEVVTKESALEAAKQVHAGFAEKVLEADFALQDYIKLQEQRVRLDQARVRRAQAQQDLDALDGETLEDVAAPADTQSVLDECNAAVRKLQAEIREEGEAAKRVGKGEAARERASVERTKLAKAIAKREGLADLKRSQQKLRAKVIEQLVEPVAEAANRLLQSIDLKMEFKFIFEREEKLYFDFGFEKDGVFRSFGASSTGEEAALAVVLVAALIEVVQPAWRVLLVDNAESIDGTRRRDLMEALVRAEDLFDNVIMAGCSRFADVEGWQVDAFVNGSWRPRLEVSRQLSE